MDNLEDKIALYLQEKSEIALSLDICAIAALARDVIDTWQTDGDVFIFANGGTAATAEHLATDLSMHPFVSEDKTEVRETRRLRVTCLSSSPSLITGISNDLGFDQIFKVQLQTFRDSMQNALVIGFSASGNSKNVVEALKYARKAGALTACVSGNPEGNALDWCDTYIPIPGSSSFPGQTGDNDNCFHNEDFFMSIGHILTGLLKEIVNE